MRGLGPGNVDTSATFLATIVGLVTYLIVTQWTTRWPRRLSATSVSKAKLAQGNSCPERHESQPADDGKCAGWKSMTTRPTNPVGPEVANTVTHQSVCAARPGLIESF